MRRRKLLIVLVLAGLTVVVVMAGAVVLWPQPPSRITRENFDRIKEGMSRAEVEAILGSQNGGVIIMGGLPPIQIWEGERGVANVQFGRHGGALEARFLTASPARESSPLARLRTWLGW